MKRRLLPAVLVVVLAALACDEPFAPPPPGSIVIRFASSQAARAPSAPPAGGLVAQESNALALTSADISVSGPSGTKTAHVDFNGASSGTARIDSLLPGNYTVTVLGLVADTVDSYGQATTTVSAGATATVDMGNPGPGGTAWGSLRPTLQTITTYAPTSFTLPILFSSVATATSYEVQWSKSSSFASGNSSKTAPVNAEVVMVGDTGTFYVRVQAKGTPVPNPRWSDTKSVAVVASTVGDSTPGGAQPIHPGVGAVDTTLQGLNLLPAVPNDWFSIDVCRQDTLTIETRASGPPLTSPLNTLLRLFRSDGITQVKANDDLDGTTTDSRIVDTLTVDGTHKIQVTEQGNTYGHYELHVTLKQGPQNTGTSCVPPGPASVDVTPDTVRLGAVGDTARPVATAFDAIARPLPGTTFTWVSRNTAVFSVNVNTGKVTAVGNGGAYVVATATGGPSGPVSDSAFVTVTRVISLSKSTVQASASTVAAGSAVTLTLTAKDSAGVQLPTGGLAVAFSFSGGGSAGTVGPVTDNGNGTYTASLTGQTVGTPSTVGATIGGSAVTSPLPTVTVTPGPASKVGFAVQPGGATAGGAIQPNIVAVVQDAFNNPVPTATGSVTMTIGTNPSGGTLFGTVSKPLITGTATFSDLYIDKAGNGYTLTATSGVLAVGTSDPFNITGGAAKKVTFTVQPSNAPAATNIAPAIKVAIQDSLGNTVTGATNSVTLALQANPGAATLSGTLTKSAVNGVATFDSVRVDKLANGYTLQATSTSLTSATSAAFNVTAGAPAALVFNVEPTNAQAGTAISPAIQVKVVDVGGNTVTAATDPVSVALLANPGSATLSGTSTVMPSSGIATFTNLSLNKSGIGYTLLGTSGVLTPDTSAGFNISAAAAYKLAFAVQPTVTTAGATITPHPTVKIQDAFGNDVTTATNFVNMAFQTNPSGGTLSGNTSRQASGGTATFDDLSIDKAGVGYKLAATATSLLGDSSTAFDVQASATVSASQSTATANPSADVRVVADTATITVTVRDPGGNPIQAQTVQIAADGTGNTLIQPAGNTNASGVATAKILSTKAELKNVTVTVNPSGTAVVLDQHPTVIFVADTGAVSKTLSLVTATPDTVIGDGIQEATISVTVKDSLGNLVAGRAVQLATSGTGNLVQPGLTDGSGATSGAISRASNGRDTVTAIVSPATSNDTLATRPVVVFIADTSLLSVTLSTVDFTPDTVAADGAQTASITVTVRDTLGNGMPGQTVQIAVSGSGNVVNQPVAPTDGAGVALGSVRSTVAQLKTVTVTVNPGPDQHILASHPQIPFKAGNPFGIVFRVQPSTTTAGIPMAPGVQVAVVDANNNTVSDDVRPVTVRLLANPTGGTLFGDTVVNAVAGVATFSNLSMQAAATGYTLQAEANMLGTTTSSAFAVSAADGTHLGFEVEPTNVAAGAFITPAVKVKVLDTFENTVTSATNSITMAIATSPDTATLSGTKTRSAVAGVATFDNLSINRTGNGYTLGSSSTGLTGATSAAFNVTAAGPSQLKFTIQPSSATAGVALASVEVTVQDAFGNKVTGDADTVTISIADDPSGGSATLGGTRKKTAIAGVATFTDLTIDKAGLNYSLRAARTGLSQDFSLHFNITAAAASQLAFTVQPTVAVAGVSISPAVKVTARDPFGNTATTFTDSVTVALGVNPSGGTLSGTKKVAAIAGIATFSTLNVDKVGTGYTLTANANALTGTESNPFNVTVAGAARVAFIQEPSTTAAGHYVSPPIQVQLQDQFGNPVGVGTNPVSLSMLNNPSGGALLGKTTVSAVSGVATFDSVTVDKVATGYTLLATATSLTPDTSAGFDVSAGDPDAGTSTVAAAPPSVIADGVQTSTITVVVRDAYGNVAAGHAATLAASGSNNTITDPAGPTDGTGTATGTIASTTAEPKTITATVDGSVALTQEPTVTFVADISNVSATLSTLVVTEDTVEANGSSTATVTVTVKDPNGNLIQGQTVEIAASGTGNAITQPAGPSDVNGEITATIAATKAESKIVSATVDPAGTPKVLSQTDTVVFKAGPAAQVGFVVEPTSVAAGAALTPSVQVAVQDAQGNTVPGATDVIDVALIGGTSGAALYGTASQMAVTGVATFPGLKVDSAGSGYQLHATSGSYNPANSATFDVFPGPVYTISVTPNPDSLFVLGDMLSLTATARDSVGNVRPGETFTWASTNDLVASVDPGSGLVTAVKHGLANINANAGGKVGTANFAVAVRVAEIASVSHGSLFSSLFSGNLPGRYEAIDPATYNGKSVAQLRQDYDVLLFGYDTDASTNADWATRLRPYLGLGGGVLFESQNNVGDLSPAITAVAQNLTNTGIVVLPTPRITASVVDSFVDSYTSFTAWNDSLAHFVVRGDTALGLYGRFGSGCIALTGPAPAHWADPSGTATQMNLFQLLLNEVRFAADCPLSASPGPAQSVRVFPTSVTFTTAGASSTPRATALDSVGTPVPGAPITWSSTNDSVVTVNPSTGQITSVRNGQASVRASGSGADYVVASVNTPAAVVQNAWGIEQAPGALSNTYIAGMWGTASNDVFAVGFGGVIRHYNGMVWDTIPSGVGVNLWRVWGTAHDDVFAVGDGGTILHYNGSSVASMPNPASGGATIYDVWGSSPTDVFAVGPSGTVLHYNGSDWTSMASGTVETLVGVFGFSSRNVYAVGWNNAVVHFDGVHWTPVTPPGGGPYYFQSIWGAAQDDLWAITSGGPIFHYDGANWTQTPNPAGAADMWRVWGTSANEVYATGSGPTILKYNGSTWNRMATPITSYVLSLWGTSGGRLLAVGGSPGVVLHGERGATVGSLTVSPAGTILTAPAGTVALTSTPKSAAGDFVSFATTTWSSLNTTVAGVNPSTGLVTTVGSGSAAIAGTIGGVTGYGFVTVNDPSAGTVNLWDGQETPAANAMYGIWGFADNDVFAVGTGGQIWHFDGTTWNSQTSNTPNFLWSVWGAAPNDVYAVGNSNTIMHYDGSWSAVTSPAPGGTTIYRVWGTAPNDVFAVGSGGSILHYDGANWTTMTSGTTNPLYGVWGTAPNNVFASGASGTLLRYDGTAWTPLVSGTAVSLYDVWGSSTTNIFAVGDGGTILRSTNNGSTWPAMVSGAASWFWSVYARSATEAYAVGINGLYRFNGSAWAPMVINTGGDVRGIWGLSGTNNLFTAGNNTPAVLRSRGPLKVAGVGFNGGNAATGSVFANGDLAGTYSQITDATFNGMTPAQLRANYDVLVFTWNTPGTLDADWATRLVPYMNLGGGVVWEDNVNVGDLAAGMTAVNGALSGAPFTLTSVPGLTNGVTNDLNHYHFYISAPGGLTPFIRDAASNIVGTYGRFGAGCGVFTGPDPDYHAVKGALDYTGNEYVFLVDKIRWAAGC